jgi:F420-dependent oxidoreductase-like protein
MSAEAIVRIPHRALVVLVGPVASGKSTWAERWFAGQVVSSDSMRAIVGEGEHDQRASKDAFAVLEDVLDRRLRRGLLTVVDSLALDGKQRERYRAIAAKHGVSCVAVVFDTAADECRARNRRRARPVPPKVLSTQLQGWAVTLQRVAEEPFDAVHVMSGTVDVGVRVVPSGWEQVGAAAARQREEPMAMKFGLQIPRFAFDGGPGELGHHLEEIARRAEDAGFSSLWVMDHFLQIPQVGREWEDMLDSYTTLSFLAGVTRRVTLGAMVTGVTYRSVAHLGKIVATLDVLSRGRAVCGIGAAWFEREHKAYGWDFPPLKERYALLEDALELLPLMWGSGAPAFEGRTIKVPEAICYPRPLQEHVPILVGGSGERKTLRLVAKYADACNLFGDAATVRHKVDVLRGHCRDLHRDPSTVEITHLSSAAVVDDPSSLGLGAADVARINAGSVDDQIGRFRELGEAGVQHAIVNLPLMTNADAIDQFAPVVQAFASSRAVL